MIVSPSTTAQDLVLQLREKCTLSSQKDYVLYEEVFFLPSSFTRLIFFPLGHLGSGPFAGLLEGDCR